MDNFIALCAATIIGCVAIGVTAIAVAAAFRSIMWAIDVVQP